MVQKVSSVNVLTKATFSKDYDLNNSLDSIKSKGNFSKLVKEEKEVIQLKLTPIQLAFPGTKYKPTNTIIKYGENWEPTELQDAKSPYK